jgi:hypothetical protein
MKFLHIMLQSKRDFHHSVGCEMFRIVSNTMSLDSTKESYAVYERLVV